MIWARSSTRWRASQGILARKLGINLGNLGIDHMFYLCFIRFSGLDSNRELAQRTFPIPQGGTYARRDRIPGWAVQLGRPQHHHRYGRAKAFTAACSAGRASTFPSGQDMDYTMLQIDGKNVAGLGSCRDDMQAAGMPPVWTSYVNHSDADAIAGRSD